MSDDFIERVEKSHERWTGQEWSPEKTKESFALYGKASRITALEQLDAAITEVPATEGNLRRYAKLTGLQRDLEQMHQLLLKNGR
jgi:hypothetical protein